MSPEVLGYLAAVGMGLVLGLIGGGGSILTVPILVYLFHISATNATAYSLFIVGITALAGSLNYGRRGQVDVKTGLMFATPTLIGTYAARAWLVPLLPKTIAQIGTFTLTNDIFILLAFAGIMLLAAISMLRPRRPHVANGSGLSATQKLLLTVLEGLGVGVITGFVGAGGGFLVIPVLVLLGGLPMKMAVGTSLMVIAIKSLTGFIGDLGNGLNVDWLFIISITGLALIGNFLGEMFSQRVPEATLKTSFGWFVLMMGAWIISKELHLI
jgi:hypothetical protein